jgi:hypothetical protein
VLRSIFIGISRAISSTAFVVIAILFFTQPNIYRAIVPGLFGINEVAPNIYTDKRLKVQSIKRAIKIAEQNASAFFPNQVAKPKYIVCFTPKCTNTFGKLPLGLTLGFHRVIISPRGFDQSVFNHERIHVDLNQLAGWGDIFQPRFPIWFNEGLAEFLSGSNCQGVRPNFQEIQRIQRAQSLREWNRVVSDGQFRRHYGAACRAVESIAQKIGKTRLSELAHAATNRKQFLASLPIIQ